MPTERDHDLLAEHIRECSAIGRRVEKRLAALERRLTWQQWVMPMLGSLASSVIVASAILLT